MADYKIVDAEKLDADLASVADAIRKKAGTTAKMEFPTGFEEAVESILTGGVELPTLANPGDASDLAKGKQMVDQYGNVVDGTLKNDSMVRLTGGNAYGYFGESNGVLLEASADADRIIRAGDDIGVVATFDKFGNATAADVAKGKTFTSAAGFIVKGEHECEGGVELPTLTNHGTATDLARDKELIDQNGNVVTGTLYELDSINESIFGTKDFAFGGTPGGTTFNVKGAYNVDIDGVIVRKGAGLGVRNAPTDFFGDARPEDVKAGKTFTSAAGLLVTGTASGGTGGGFTVTDDGEGNVTITSSAITDNNGDVVIG